MNKYTLSEGVPCCQGKNVPLEPPVKGDVRFETDDAMMDQDRERNGRVSLGLPMPRPKRYQFSLLRLLGIMTVASVLAAAIRPLFEWLSLAEFVALAVTVVLAIGMVVAMVAAVVIMVLGIHEAGREILRGIKWRRR